MVRRARDVPEELEREAQSPHVPDQQAELGARQERLLLLPLAGNVFSVLYFRGSSWQVWGVKSLTHVSNL